LSSIPTTLQQLSETTPHSSLFQHKSVEQAHQVTTGTQKLPDASDWTRRDLLVQAHQAWKDRIDQITQIVNGDWYRVWPDLTREPSAPTVANTIEMAISHFSSIGGSIVPSVRVPVPHNLAGPEGSRGAAKRERRIREIEEKSNVNNLLASWFGDYSGGGAAAAFVWTDFSLPEEERNPVIHRVDPRHYYPVTDAQGNVLEVLVARRVHAYETIRRYPELTEYVNVDEADLEEWFWFTPDRIRHIIADVSPTGRKNKMGMVLLDVENELGVTPVIEIVRPSFDGERRGIHDQTIHILRVQHHLMNLTIEATEEDVYSPITYYEAEGVETFGPGAQIRLRTPDASVQRVPTQSRFDVKDLISRLEEQARFQSVFPVQLTGDPGASIASNRAIQGSQGALNARLALAHKQFEWFMEKIASLVLRFDETYCKGTKTIYGDAHDRKKPEAYNPERDVAGNYEVTRSYGLGVGSDPVNKETRLQMAVASQLISKASARDETDYIKDGLHEEKLLAKETMIAAVSQGIMAQAGQGNVDVALIFFELLNDPDLTMEEVLIKFHAEQKRAAEEAARAQAEQAGGTVSPGPGDVAAGAESLARGGIPGSAEGALPAGAALPAAPPIMGEGAPAQVL
jgi:hypothetical protein